VLCTKYYYSDNIGVCGRIILKFIKEMDCEDMDEFTCLITGIIGRLS
jgi:hypothetical protein